MMIRTSNEPDDRLLRSLGARLEALRRRAGKSQREVAARIGCRHPMLGRYERGEHYPPFLVLLDDPSAAPFP